MDHIDVDKMALTLFLVRASNWKPTLDQENFSTYNLNLSSDSADSRSSLSF